MFWKVLYGVSYIGKIHLTLKSFVLCINVRPVQVLTQEVSYSSR